MMYKLNESQAVNTSDLTKANDKLEEALVEANNLIKELTESNDWKGETKNSILVLITLCSKFHKDILDISIDNVKNLESIIRKSNEFVQEDELIRTWR